VIDLREEEDAFDLMRVNSESVSNEVNETESEHEDSEQRS
jgi:hypothetical protein